MAALGVSSPPKATYPKETQFNRDLSFALGLIRFLGEVSQEVEEVLALTIEEPTGGQAHHCGLRPGLGRGNRPDHRAERQMRADELARRRHDLVGVVWSRVVNAVRRRIGCDRELRKDRVP